MPSQVITAHGAAVKALAWCPWLRRTLASGGATGDQKIRVWDARVEHEIGCIDAAAPVCPHILSRCSHQKAERRGAARSVQCKGMSTCTSHLRIPIPRVNSSAVALAEPTSSLYRPGHDDVDSTAELFAALCSLRSPQLQNDLCLALTQLTSTSDQHMLNCQL
jgi:hypothetical protein